VGNSDTKEYVEPEHFADVPVDKRVFFASEVEAEENGYIPACANMEPPREGLKSVQLLSMNDLHGKIDQTYRLNDQGIEAAGTYGVCCSVFKKSGS
jgi:hypothetical protein